MYDVFFIAMDSHSLAIRAISFGVVLLIVWCVSPSYSVFGKLNVEETKELYLNQDSILGLRAA